MRSYLDKKHGEIHDFDNDSTKQFTLIYLQKLKLDSFQANIREYGLNTEMHSGILIEDLDSRFGKHVTKEKKKRKERILSDLTKTLGDDYCSLPIRGDNNCSKRSLIFGTLIAAAKLVKKGDRNKALALLQKIEDSLNYIVTHISEFRNFSPNDSNEIKYIVKHSENIKKLLQLIKDGEVSMAALALQASIDCLKEIRPNASEINLALADLAGYIMHIGFNSLLEKKTRELGCDNKEEAKFFLDGTKVLNSGAEPSSSTDRIAFCLLMGINHKTAIARLEATGGEDIFQEEGSNNPENIKIFTITTGGHTTLALHSEDVKMIRDEINALQNSDINNISNRKQLKQYLIDNKNSLDDSKIQNLFKKYYTIRSAESNKLAFFGFFGYTRAQKLAVTYKMIHKQELSNEDRIILNNGLLGMIYKKNI